jgi:hypothetical protein
VGSPPTDPDQFLRLRARLQAVAAKHGDAAFAEALSRCVVDASGGAPHCPMGELFLQRYADSGRMPDPADPRTRPRHPLTASDPPPYDRQRLMTYLQRVLEERALLHGDLQYVEALHACQGMTRDSAACPLHRFIDQDSQ